MKLYELSGSYSHVQQMIEEDMDNESLQDTLDALNEAFEDKVESIIKLIRSKESEKQMIDDEIKRLSERSAKVGKKTDWLKGYVFNQMIAAEKEEVKSSLFSIRIATNPPKLNVLDETLIPQEYFKSEFVQKLNKKAVKEAIEGGKEIKGAQVVQEKRLSVK